MSVAIVRRVSEERTRVLYDEDCGFCRWSLDKILAWDRHERLDPMPIQSAEGQRLLAGVPEALRLDSWHLVTPAGEVHSAGAGLPALFTELPGGAPLAALTRHMPKLSDRGYRAVAGNRDRLARLLRIDATCSVRRS